MGRTAGPFDDEAVVEILHEAGLRATVGRCQIVHSLATSGHATPEEIFLDVSRTVPDLNLSTVYRTLETLADVGLAFHTHLTGITRSYYLTGGDDHAHLVCDSCGQVSELSGPSLTRFAASVARNADFEIQAHHLTVHGTCRSCRDVVAAGQPPR